MYGWMGRRLRLDLAEGAYEIETPPPEYYKKWIGGRGMNVEVTAHQTPHLSLAAGPLVGTFSPLSGNTVLTVRHPVNGVPRGRCLHGGGNAVMGGTFGAMMKYAGYDQIVLSGKAPKPVYIFIDNDRIRFHDADHLRGLGVRETTLRIREERVDPEIKVIVIGPAGENRVRFSGIAGDFNVEGGAQGMGGIMGAMNLKAIAVRGRNPVHIADPAGLANTAWTAHQAIKGAVSEGRRQQDFLAAYLEDSGKKEILEQLQQETQFMFKKISCWSCPGACGTSVYITEGQYAGLSCGTGDIERFPRTGTGSGGMNSINSVILLSAVACDLGMDAVLAGAVLPMIMEIFEKNGTLGQEYEGYESCKQCENIDLDNSIKALTMTARGRVPANLPAGALTALLKRCVDNGAGDMDLAGEPFERLEAATCAADMLGGCVHAAHLHGGFGADWEDLYLTLFRHVTGIDFSEHDMAIAVERTLDLEKEIWRSDAGEPGPAAQNTTEQ